MCSNKCVCVLVRVHVRAYVNAQGQANHRRRFLSPFILLCAHLSPPPRRQDWMCGRALWGDSELAVKRGERDSS